MYTLDQTERFEQEIRKSRFIAIACPVDTEADAKARLAEVSDPSANHNCWAWRIGQAYRFSDDGEPSGTAGKPILQAIDGQALDRTLVVVTRWFGGILLGSGGLIRAYGGTAALCLRAAAKTEYVERATLAVSLGFSDLALVKARLAALPGLLMDDEAFHESGARLVFRVPAEQAEETSRLVIDLTSGRAEFGA
ncbi:IMPACT family protein [Shinella sumterensis]|uniref:YigZ family protein n=1 Tax=Shinella sumterensis TaxID=1967501 RepID=A0AA50CIW7_9HYPH|nr:YigZ family protein [Shinella sumterensis]MDP9592229.1 putative YigZ family protein [Shinella zoogloeoides]WLR96697.1 YigZ family protein [Shinella sumterensis]